GGGFSSGHRWGILGGHPGYNEEKLNLIMNRHKNLKIENIWITEDVRAERKNEYWMNILIIKR
ncbi:MAG TPA: hypothetical protein PK178_00675, partial [Smithellaceae bacterium]|nr:hypothetical protein [Smithellaceae bacterium]